MISDGAAFCPYCGKKVFPDDAAAADVPPADLTGLQPKKKKTGLIAAIVAVLIIAAGVGGYYIYQSTPKAKLSKLRTQISSSMESKDYEGAMDLIAQAEEFAPEDEELRRQYVECCKMMLLDLYSQGKTVEFIVGTQELIKIFPEAAEDEELCGQYVEGYESLLLELFAHNEYDEFIAEADKLIEDHPEAAEDLDPLVKQAYELLAFKAEDTGDITTMQDIKARLTEAQGSGRFDFSKTISMLEDSIYHVKLTDLFQTLADKMIPLINAGDRAAVFETIRNEFIKSGGSARKLAPSQDVVNYHYPLYSSADEAGNRLGLYYSKGHYFFYYGPYNGTRREGNGAWICADNLKSDTSYREYWAEGPWSVDKPNGTFSFSQLSKYASSDEEQLIEGTAEVKNGLYEGKVSYLYPGTPRPGPVIGTFHNGLANVIMTTDPNGKETNVIMISEDRKVWYSRSNINDPMGIYGYY
ncbi:MAG: hypothetical protein IKX89_04875 [Firmicutes bacterium]|nr:hypothetical protein [Bacillota bacterium]